MLHGIHKQNKHRKGTFICFLCQLSDLKACLAVGPVGPVDDGVFRVEVRAVDHVLLGALPVHVMAKLT